MTVTVENIRGGENIQVPLLFNLEINIEHKPHESATVSGVLDLEEHCTSSRKDPDIFRPQSDSYGDPGILQSGFGQLGNGQSQGSKRKKDKKYYTSGEVTAYIFVGVLSSLLLVIIALGVLWYLKRRKRKREKNYSITMRKSARRIESWTRKDSDNTTVEEWHQRNTLQSTDSSRSRALTDATFMDTPLPSIMLDQQVLFSQEM